MKKNGLRILGAILGWIVGAGLFTWFVVNLGGNVTDYKFIGLAFCTLVSMAVYGLIDIRS